MTQDINYKVNVDTSDLSSQLQAAKSQIDATLAQQSFQASMPDMSSRMFAFPDMSSTHVEAANSIRSAMDTARLGFQKFNSDMQNLALMTPVTMPSLSSAPGGTPDFQSMSGSRSAFEAMTNWGYSPRMGLSPGEYAFRARQSFGDKSLDFAGSVAGTLGWAGLFGSVLSAAGVGGATTAVLGPLGLIAGAAEVGYEVFGHDFQNANKSRMFARDTSWRFLSGRFNSSDASRIGLEASKLQRMDDVMGERLSNNDVQALQKEYTELGGFDYVRTAEEYRTKLKDLIANHTKVLQTLKTASKEASQAMAEWDWMGLTGANTTSTQFATTIAAQAYNAGYTPTEFLQFAKQSQEMIRGTGIGFGSAYVGGMNALGVVKDAMQNGAIPGQAVTHLGGAENAAATVLRTGYNFGMSQAGLTYLAAESYYGSNANVAGMSVNNILGGAFNKINSPLEYMEFKGGIPDILSKKDPTELYLMQANTFAKEMEYIHIPITKNTWRFQLGQYGKSASEADLMYGIMTSPGISTGEQYRRIAYETLAQQPNPMDVGMDLAGNVLGRAFGGATDWFEKSRGKFSMIFGDMDRAWKEGIPILMPWGGTVNFGSGVTVRDISYATKYQALSAKTLINAINPQSDQFSIMNKNTDIFNQLVADMTDPTFGPRFRSGSTIENIQSKFGSLLGENLYYITNENYELAIDKNLQVLNNAQTRALKNLDDLTSKEFFKMYPATTEGKRRWLVTSAIAGNSKLKRISGSPKSNLKSIEYANQVVDNIVEDALSNLPKDAKSSSLFNWATLGIAAWVGSDSAYNVTAEDLGFQGNPETGLKANQEMFGEFLKAFSLDKNDPLEPGRNIFSGKFKDKRVGSIMYEQFRMKLNSGQAEEAIATITMGAMSNELKVSNAYASGAVKQLMQSGIDLGAFKNETELMTALQGGNSFNTLYKIFNKNLNNPDTQAKAENIWFDLQEGLSGNIYDINTRAAAKKLRGAFSSESVISLTDSIYRINQIKEGIKPLIKDNQDFTKEEESVLGYMNTQSLKNIEYGSTRLAGIINNGALDVRIHEQ